MRKLANCRITEIEIDGVWTVVHWEQLDEGDIIRFRNPDGSPLPEVYEGLHIVSQTPALKADKYVPCNCVKCNPKVLRGLNRAIGYIDELCNFDPPKEANDGLADNDKDDPDISNR